MTIMKTSTTSAKANEDHVTRVYLRLSPRQQLIFSERLRRDRNIKIKDVAIGANVSRTTFYNILRGGELVAREKIEAVARQLDIDPAEVFSA